MTGRGPLGFRSAPVQRLRLLASERSARQQQLAYVVEGVAFVSDALRDANVASLYVEEGFDLTLLGIHDASAEVIAVESGVLARVGGVQSPQGVAAIVTVSSPTERFESDGSAPVVLADRIADPGNLGTLLRSAEAAGVTGVVLTPGSTDPYNPKAVRASAGSVMRVPVVSAGSSEAALDAGRFGGRRLVGASMDRGMTYDAFDWHQPSTLVLGNEAHGISPALAERLDDWIHIPMGGRTESLNVAMSAAICLFEAQRQRRIRRSEHAATHNTHTEEQSHVAR